MRFLKNWGLRNSTIGFGENFENKKVPSQGLFVGETGLEPATSAMSKQCSNQLSYPPEGLTL